MMGTLSGSFDPRGNLYCYADTVIDSAWALGYLSRAESAASDGLAIAIGLLDEPPCEPVETDWVHHWSPQSRSLSLALSGDGKSYLLRFTGLADFVISKGGFQIEVWPAPPTGLETLRHLLLDQVLPRILAQQGRLVLHAGAVRIGDQAIAFMGGSGSGKSTLTASFHAAGYPLLCDDGLVLTQGEGVTLALPTYSSLRLWPESIASLYAQAPALAPMAHYSSKRRVVLTDIAANGTVPLPLTSFYILGLEAAADNSRIELSRLSPRAASMAIIGNSFQLDVTDRSRVTDVFSVACRIAAHLPVFSLAYPRDFARLPEVHDAILRQRSE